jgi:hypothetical protein
MAISKSMLAVNISCTIVAAIVMMSSLGSRNYDCGANLTATAGAFRQGNGDVVSSRAATGYLFLECDAEHDISPVMYPAHQSLGRWDCYLEISETISSRSPNLGAVNQSAP